MLGAYGFELLGTAEASSQLVEAGADWPTLEVVRRTGSATVGRSVVGAHRAEIRLLAGEHLLLEREPLRATFTTANPLSDDALIHPYLAPAAAVAGYWLGREAFHAGGLVVNGGVWGVMGGKESGKSSLLAWLSLEGHAIHADDALVVDGDTTFAGPRSIDLREEPARELGAGEPMGTVGDRERWRLRLGPVDSASRLRGWVFLAWSDAVDVAPVAAGRTLKELLGHRIVKGLPPPDPARVLELSALPAFEVGRPRRWSQLASAGGRLVEVLSDR
jgi:hypothetical protein